MKNNPQIKTNRTDEIDTMKEIMANQELIANPVRYQIERSMEDILTERAAERNHMKIASAFIP